MEHTLSLKHNYTTVFWAVLLIWWGVVIIIDPLTIGIGAIGSGLILIGISAVCSMQSIPIDKSNYAWGGIAIAWGALDTIFKLSFGASFAVLIITVGVVMIGSLLVRRKFV
jgi:hypothetical protein